MKRIVTISREFGSGGRTIARKLAERLEWKYWDKELVKEVAAASGFDPDYVEENGEHSATRSPLGYLLSSVGTPGVMNGLSANDFLWVIQRSVVERLPDEGPCVIVGRCADYILRNRDDTLNVFVHAPLEVRADRIVRLYGESEQRPEERLKAKDKRRRNYYHHYTGGEWGASHNYDLCLNTGTISIDRCVDLIESIVRE